MKSKINSKASNHQSINDIYSSQQSSLLSTMSEQQKSEALNTKISSGGASLEEQKEHIKNCLEKDFGYGTFIAYALGIPLSELH